MISFTERAIMPDLKDPILISAFSSPQKGGDTASAALAYGLQQWKAQPVAEFSSGGFYSYAHMRPWVQRSGETTVIHWPRNIVYRVDGDDHSYLILAGVEPTLNWEEFAEGVANFAMRMGVRTAVGLQSFAGMVAHTLPVPVRAAYSDPEIKSRYCIEEVEQEAGPADFARILNICLANRGCQTVDLFALEPLYISGAPNPSAGAALLKALESFGLTCDLVALEEEATSQRQAIDSAMASSEQMRQMVRDWERTSVEMGLAKADHLSLASGEPVNLNIDEVMREAEAIFRRA
jgi:hypothetical protein